MFQLKGRSHFGSRQIANAVSMAAPEVPAVVARVESQPGLSHSLGPQSELQSEGVVVQVEIVAGVLCEANGSGELFGPEDEMEEEVTPKRPRLSPPQDLSFEALLRVADKLQGDGRTKGYWRRCELTKLEEWAHLVGGADLEKGAWILCKPCCKKIDCAGAPYNITPFKVHCQRPSFATLHLKR